MPQDFKALYDAYRPEMESYKQLAELVSDVLTDACRNAGLLPIVTARPKDMRSLLKKCALHDGPVEKVRDRAGVKVVTRYVAEVTQIEEIITRTFDDVSGPDTKIDSYKPEELGYLGTHFHVRLKPEQTKPGLEGLECEIILHTGAETLWDSISHQLLYKPFVELSPSAKRSLMRLLALVELFDKEVTAIRKEYTEMPEYETAHMLDVLEKYFYRIDPRQYRRELSVKIIEALAPALSDDKRRRFDEEMEQFVTGNMVSLEAAYGNYLDPDSYQGLFLHQPESLLVFAMFEWHQKDDVKNAWLPLYSRESLEELSAIWGISITDH